MNEEYFTIWLTGRPCSGKTTIAEGLTSKLKKEGFSVSHLDGDDVRKGLNSDLGFTKEDRYENLRRIGHVAEIFNKKENYVIASFVSPREEYRELLSDIISDFKLVYVNASLEECIERDVKGMYKEALEGKKDFFTGIDPRSPFETPLNTELILNTDNESIEESIDKIYEKFFGKQNK